MQVNGKQRELRAASGHPAIGHKNLPAAMPQPHRPLMDLHQQLMDTVLQQPLQQVHGLLRVGPLPAHMVHMQQNQQRRYHLA
jgi:hypothetical protein